MVALESYLKEIIACSMSALGSRRSRLERHGLRWGWWWKEGKSQHSFVWPNLFNELIVGIKLRHKRPYLTFKFWQPVGGDDLDKLIVNINYGISEHKEVCGASS